MKRIIGIITAVLIIFSAAVAYAESDGGGDPGKVLPVPGISAQSAILIEAASGEVLYEKNADQKAYPASITKIMTALLAIENGAMDESVKVSAQAAAMEGSSIYLEPGEKLPLRDLLYGLMLRSGNDAAAAVAEKIGGSTKNFALMMNKRARSIGAFDTHFMNPSGLHDPEHYTTARDMAKISAVALKNPEFKKIAATKSWIADRGEGKYNYFYNKNKVVYQYSGGTGIKIGYTRAAGRTLVASSERNGMELICVVMNAPDWFQDTYKLMDYAYSQYETIRIMEAGQPLKAVGVWSHGKKKYAMIGSKTDILCPVKRNSEYQISVVYDLPEKQTAPVARWQEAGHLKIYINGTYLYSSPLCFFEDVE